MDIYHEIRLGLECVEIFQFAIGWIMKNWLVDNSAPLLHDVNVARIIYWEELDTTSAAVKTRTLAMQTKAEHCFRNQ